ncbi:hypothetical protein LTR08_000444 [Meristemomyces frigidus]|nr:hypothetical protein LTR08_000444 [Meristemomyces frigidus]
MTSYRQRPDPAEREREERERREAEERERREAEERERRDVGERERRAAREREDLATKEYMESKAEDQAATSGIMPEIRLSLKAAKNSSNQGKKFATIAESPLAKRSNDDNGRQSTPPESCPAQGAFGAGRR